MNDSLGRQLARAFHRSPASEQVEVPIPSPPAAHPAPKNIRRLGTSIDASVERLIIQFSCSNERVVPRWLFEKGQETLAERETRKSNPHKGKCFLPPTANLSGEGFRQSIEKAGLHLVDAFYTPRVDAKRAPTDGRHPSYHMMRYLFCRTPDDHARTETWRQTIADQITPSLDTLFANALWRMRGYENPYVRNGAIVEGRTMISVNMEDRKALVDHLGKPIAGFSRAGTITLSENEFAIRK